MDSSNLLVILFIVILLVYLYYRHYYQFGIESYQEQEPKLESKPVYFLDSIEYHQMEKVSQIKDGDNFISFWERKPDPALQYLPLGSTVLKTSQEITSVNDLPYDKYQSLRLLAKNGKEPLEFVLIWKSQESINVPSKNFSVWKMIAPVGYQAMGDIVVPGFEKPSKKNYQCLPENLLELSNQKIGQNLYTEKTQEDNPPVSIWEISDSGFMMGSPNHNKPTEREDQIFKIKEDALNSVEIDPEESNFKYQVTVKA